jgi:hypothetical protein
MVREYLPSKFRGGLGLHRPDDLQSLVAQDLDWAVSTAVHPALRGAFEE